MDVWIRERPKPATWAWVLRRMKPGDGIAIRREHKRAVQPTASRLSNTAEGMRFVTKLSPDRTYLVVRRTA